MDALTPTRDNLTAPRVLGHAPSIGSSGSMTPRARDDGGSGLGLAIVAELVGDHGGTVTAAHGRLGCARIEVTWSVERARGDSNAQPSDP
jgi:hypothetical protein